MNTQKGYVNTEYLQGAAEHLNQIKQCSYEFMQIKDGHKALDMGCGPGIDTINLSKLVGPEGEVIGVDFDDTMVTNANKFAEKSGVSGWVKHQKSDATSLPFTDEYFDATRSERVFQHLLNPAVALQELMRVTKTGGWIVVMDTDWGSLSIDSDDTETERNLARFLADKSTYNGYSGRKLYRLFKEHKLTDLQLKVSPIVTTSFEHTYQGLNMQKLETEIVNESGIPENQLSDFFKNLQKADADGVFFGYMTIIMVAGKKV